MHMADALLSPTVGGVMLAASAGALAYATAKTKKDELGEKKMPVMAVTGAFVFAAQMINFAIPATGSSGHIGGGMLLAAVLGGAPALLSLACVLIIQCLFFADGGLLALGCNIFNMGVIPCLLVYPLIYKPIVKKGLSVTRITVASVLSTVVALQLGSFAVVLQTLISGVTELPFVAFSTLMQPIHLAIGVIEGIITAAVLCFVYKMRPEIIEASVSGRSLSGVSTKRVVVSLAILAILVGGGLSLLASSNPDGLEWSILGTSGVDELEASSSAHDSAAEIQEKTALMPDYGFASSEGDDTSVAGIVGSVMTFALAGLAGIVITKTHKRARKSST